MEKGTLSFALLLLFFLTKLGVALETPFTASQLAAETTNVVEVQEANTLKDSRDGIKLSSNWKFHPGDNPEWARPELDDSDWEKIRLGTFPFDRWQGIGWLRFVLEVDSALWNVPLALSVPFARGAYEFYLDGELVYRIGKVGTTEKAEKAHYGYHTPQTIIFRPTSKIVAGKSPHLLAMRYSSFYQRSPVWSGARPAGLWVIQSYDEVIQASAQREIIRRKVTTHQMLLTGVFLAFSLMHLLLFLFYPQLRANLYFAGISAGFALNAYVVFPTFYDSYFITDPAIVVWVNRLLPLAMILTLLLAFRLTYFLIYPRLPNIFFALCFVGFGLILLYWFRPFKTPLYLVLFLSLTLVEFLRALIMSRIKKRRTRLEGGWIILLGMIPGALVTVYYLLAYEPPAIVPPPPWTFADFPAPFYAQLLLLISVSVFLSRNSAKTTKDLIAQLRLTHELRMQQFQAEKLRELDQMKSRFFANISHEFRTPLTLILGPLQRLLSEDFSANIKQQFELMKRQGQRLVRLINQLLDLSKLEAGQMVLRARPGNLAKIIRQVVASFESAAARKGVALTLRAPEVIIASFDRDSLEKILSNLISNALKFTPEGGKVEVMAELQVEAEKIRDSKPESLQRGWIEMTVKDTGIGIPAEQLDRIFDRFYQVDQSATRTHEGTGIGLALTKELVELHGGEIRVESEAGCGSFFLVRLPQGQAQMDSQIVEEPELETDLPEAAILAFELEQAEKPEVGSETAQEPGTEQELPIVLVVEDSRDMRSYIREILDKEFGVLETENGTNGLKNALETIPDLVVSDVMMPGMDGFELCKKLKTDERTCHIPVILLTARASGESKISGLEIGADDYLTKPFDAHELEVRVKNLIEQRRKLRERFSREITLQPLDVAVTSMDARFLERAMAVIDEHIADPDFTPEQFARKVALSRMQLHRKLRALTNQTTGEFIRTMRLRRAAQLLRQKSGTVTEIAYEVGFNSLSHFARSFKALFGQLPSEYEKSRQT
ncbi:MAG: ATP-binding protein [bacterium]